jgi:hypothetical protein
VNNVHKADRGQVGWLVAAIGILTLRSVLVLGIRRVTESFAKETDPLDTCVK